MKHHVITMTVVERNRVEGGRVEKKIQGWIRQGTEEKED